MSLSLLRKVEQGSVPASPAFTSAAAHALGLGPAELLGQPYPRETPTDHRIFAVVPVLRRELTAYLLPPEDDAPVRPTAQLGDAVAGASKLRHAVDLNRLGAELPGLLAELCAAGLPKDGTWCYQRFSVGTLMIEAGFELSSSD